MGPADDIRLTFNEVADVYDRVRPSYPEDLFDDLFSLLPARPDIVEVGPGTGQATKSLLARGASVLGVEIGPATAAKLRANHPSDRLRISVGDFEVLELGERRFDALFSATAYHWISPAAQTARPAALVRPAGVVAIVDAIQVAAPEDAGFFAAAQPIYERFGQGHRGPPAPERAGVDPALRAVLEGDARFHSVTVRRYDWDQTYAAADYRDLMRSYSSTQMMTDADRTGLLDAIESFVRSDFGGFVTRPLVVTLTTALVA